MSALACLVCADRAQRRREFYWMLVVLFVAMIVAHLVGVSVCYSWAPQLCSPLQPWGR